MSKNSIGWGNIYRQSHWGNGVVDNTISWGKEQKFEALSVGYVERVKTDGGVIESIECTF